MLITFGLLVIYTFFALDGRIYGGRFANILVSRFDINLEANIPTWYTTVLLFSISMTSLLIYFLNLRLPRRNIFEGVFWLFFAGVYCFLSIDEAAMIHEIIDDTTSVRWFFVYAPIVGSFFLVNAYYFIVSRKDDLNLRNWILGGLIVYGLGGLGAEWAGYAANIKSEYRIIEFIVEEGLEMIGSIMVFMGCLYEVNNKFLKVFQIKAIDPH
jgi:hypothetical protein